MIGRTGVTALLFLILLTGCQAVPDALGTPILGSATPYATQLSTDAGAATLPPSDTPAPPTATVPAPTLSPVEARPLAITYVDNDCLVVSDGLHKVLFDPPAGLLRRLREPLEQAVPPFDGIDLILVTHAHSDHWDLRLVGEFLGNNPATMLASTQQVVDQLLAGYPALAAPAGRVQAFEPLATGRLVATLGGVELEVLNLPHGVDITNLAFIVRMGGRTFLHTGDLAGLEDLAAYELTDVHLDVLLAPYFFLIEPEYLDANGGSQMLMLVNADWVVPIHYRQPIGAVVQSRLAGSPVDLSTWIFFDEGLQTQTID